MAMDLSVAKKNMSEALGDGMKVYLQLLGLWFKRKSTREDFDHEARKLLPPDTVHLHNQFLLAILSKCQSLGASLGTRESSSTTQHSTSSSSSSPTKPTKKSVVKQKRRPHPSRPSFQQRFVPVNPLQQALPVNLPEPEPEGKGLSFASREMTIPDIGMVHGRMIVTSWDYGLDGVDDNAVRIMMHAIEAALKNILTVVLARRNAYKLREGRFRYAVGAPVPRITLRNSLNITDDSQYSEATSISSRGIQVPAMKPSLETGRRDAAVWLASAGHVPPTKSPITLWDLLEGLQVHKSAIPSHTVYSTNMERIIHKLWHPSNEEIAHEDLHCQEMTMRNELAVHASTIR